MDTVHRPEDEPFNHEAIIRHSRADSTVNLLNHSAGPSTSDLGNNGDSFYDNQGISKTQLYDPEKSDTEYAEYSRDRKYGELGMSEVIPHAQH